MFFETSVNFDHQTGWSRTEVPRLFQPGPLIASIFLADHQNIKRNTLRILKGMRVTLIKYYSRNDF
jgi:hypothetical protein